MNPDKARSLGITAPGSPEAKLVAVLCVSTNTRTGIQIVTGQTRDPVGSPCCGEPMTRQLTADSDGSGSFSYAIAFGKPGIGNEAHPFTCAACSSGYVVKPNPSRSPKERTRILMEVAS